jgi:hypothetical protein
MPSIAGIGASACGASLSRKKAVLIDADNYLLEVSRYIHLNPIRIESFSKKAVKEKWDALLKNRSSSLLGYFSVGKRRDFVDYQTVLEYIGGDNRKGRQGHLQFMGWGIEQEVENLLELGRGNGIVGDEDFILWIKENFLANEGYKREQPTLREFKIYNLRRNARYHNIINM